MTPSSRPSCCTRALLLDRARTAGPDAGPIARPGFVTENCSRSDGLSGFKARSCGDGCAARCRLEHFQRSNRPSRCSKGLHLQFFGKARAIPLPTSVLSRRRGGRHAEGVPVGETLREFGI